jgi:hypothetical protein
MSRVYYFQLPLVRRIVDIETMSMLDSELVFITSLEIRCPKLRASLRLAFAHVSMYDNSVHLSP